MRSFILIILLLVSISFKSKAQYMPIKDPAFAKFLCDSFPQVMSTDCKQLDTIIANTITAKINAVGLGITSASELNYFKKIVWVSLKSNNLQTLPDLSGITGLTDLNCSENKLSGILDLSTYKTLEIVTLNGNTGVTGITGITQLTKLRKIQLTQCNLTSFPNISSITTLQLIGIDYNRLTYTDIIPFTNQPSYSTIYRAFPQKRIPDDTKQELKQNIHSELFLEFPYDVSISGLTYIWYKNGTEIKKASENFLKLSNILETDSGTYFVKVKSNNPLLIKDSLVGTRWHLAIKGCNTITNYNLENLSDCKSLQYRLNTIDFDTLEGINKLYIENKLTHQQTEIKLHEIFTVTTGDYSLKIQLASTCTLTIDSTLSPKYATDCINYFTPNGDGIMDSWYIEYTGITKIYDANGVIIKELKSPAYWDGKTTEGLVVPDGKYMLIYDDKKFTELSLYR